MGSEAARGRFLARVRGDVEIQLSGTARFDRKPNREDGRWIFLILLLHDEREGDGEHTLTFSNALSEPLQVGSYVFGDMSARSFVGTYSHTTEGGSTGSYGGDEGTLEITESDTRVVRGRFSFQASGHADFNLWAVDSSVAIDGEFYAEIDPDTFPIAFPKPS